MARSSIIPGLPAQAVEAGDLGRCLLAPSQLEKLETSPRNLLRQVHKQAIKPETAAIIRTGAPNRHFCMHDPAVRSIKLAKVRPAKCLLQKIKPRLSKLKVTEEPPYCVPACPRPSFV